MKIPGLKIIIPAVVLAVGILGTAAMLQGRPEASRKAPDIPRPFVDALVAQPESITFRILSQGTVSPRTETNLASEVSGRITEVAPFYVVGGFFRKGDVLLRIDPHNYETAIKQASAQVAKARTHIETETALAEYALDDWRRLRSLDAIDKPPSDLTLRKPQLAEAKAELDSALAALEKAQEDLARTIIRAPYDGMVRAKIADLGQFVNPGTALISIFAVDYAEVRLPVTAADLDYLNLPAEQTTIAAGAKVTLIDSSRDQPFRYEASIVRTEGVFDTDNRVLYAVAQIPDPYGLRQDRQAPLRIGAYVEAHIQGISRDGVIVLPRYSVRNNEVWIIDAEQTLRRRSVEILRTDHDSVYVVSGLEGGDLVCLTPLAEFLPGTPVRIKEDAS